jgi:exoribonuclease R
MPRRRVVVRAGEPSRVKLAPKADAEPNAAELSAAVRAIQRELKIETAFSPDVLTEATTVAHRPSMPDLDRTDIALVTIDPVGSKDLDQALHIERRGKGYRVYYAIADVAAFVKPGGAIDREAHRRGQTLYAPDHRVPLHPAALSEDSASLLADQIRPALLWSIHLDESGEGIRVDVRRARVRSRQQFGYVEAQGLLDGGNPPEVMALLREVGSLRQQRERERGGISLSLPDQEVVVSGRSWSLTYRGVLPVENWNAQISLLTGMGAATIMRDGREGILRTMPPATGSALARLRRTARALKVPWLDKMEYPDFVRTIDPNSARGAAMLNACASLLRGAGYLAFVADVPEHTRHSALASDYAHVTAPLRRLADRYAGEICVALCAGAEPPSWVEDRLTELPKEMQSSDAAAKRFERAVLDVVEAGVLRARVGEMFDGAIVDLDDKDPRKGLIVVQDPAVEARVSSTGSRLPLGEDVSARLVEADLQTRRVRFELP